MVEANVRVEDPGENNICNNAFYVEEGVQAGTGLELLATGCWAKQVASRLSALRREERWRGSQTEREINKTTINAFHWKKRSARTLCELIARADDL